MKSSDACFAAADIIATRGHCKGIEEDASGRVCLVGALNIALCGNAFRHRALLPYAQRIYLGTQVLAILDWMCLLIENGEWPIFWNNLPGTSAEEVILLLKRTGTALAETEL